MVFSYMAFNCQLKKVQSCRYKLVKFNGWVGTVEPGSNSTSNNYSCAKSYSAHTVYYHLVCQIFPSISLLLFEIQEHFRLDRSNGSEYDLQRNKSQVEAHILI